MEKRESAPTKHGAPSEVSCHGDEAARGGCQAIAHARLRHLPDGQVVQAQPDHEHRESLAIL